LLMYFKMFKSACMVYCKTGEKYDFWTILHLIILLIYFTLYRCIYKFSNKTGVKYEFGAIFQFII
jgi:hypothetical protein